MHSKRVFEIFPEIRFLEKVVRNSLQERKGSDRLPKMDRLMENYKLLLRKEGEKEIEASLAKELGVAILFYASGMPAEERADILSRHRIEGFDKNAPHAIEFALEDCLRVKKSYAQNSREVEQPRNVLGSLLSLIVHMDELGGDDAGIFSVVESLAASGAPLDLYGRIPADQLLGMINFKMLKDSTEKNLQEDGSVVAVAILRILRTRYYIAPVMGYLNTDILVEIRTRRMWLKTETERLVRRKMENEKSIALAEK
jgi:hypothetical protein